MCDIVIHNFVFYLIILDYNSSYVFWPNCSAIFRLIFEQVECTIDNAFGLQDLALQELVKNNCGMLYTDLGLKLKYDNFLYNIH